MTAGVLSELPTVSRLPSDAARWPTPCASEGRQGYQDRSRGKRGTQVSLSTCVLKEHYGGPSIDGGQMSPAWVEWLMGFPFGWTELESGTLIGTPRSKRTELTSTRP